MAVDLWIFGYGSLVWRPAFPHIERHPACIRGWARRFWQGSPDHRGTPEAWGRVVTLVPEPGSICWGVAYRVHGHTVEETLEALDYRERGGYVRLQVPLSMGSNALSPAGLAYVATADNPHYLGPAPLCAMAEQIRGAAGESGRNVDYVLELDRALQRMGVDDLHVSGLACELFCPRGSKSLYVTP